MKNEPYSPFFSSLRSQKKPKRKFSARQMSTPSLFCSFMLIFISPFSFSVKAYFKELVNNSLVIKPIEMAVHRLSGIARADKPSGAIVDTACLPPLRNLKSLGNRLSKKALGFLWYSVRNIFHIIRFNDGNSNWHFLLG